MRTISGRDYLQKESGHVPVKFSAVHRIEDVVQYLRFRLKLRRWQDIDICQGTKLLTEDTLLGTLAEETGNVELTATCHDFTPAEMRHAALKRAHLYQQRGDWTASDRELSEAEYWVAEESESIASSN